MRGGLAKALHALSGADIEGHTRQGVLRIIAECAIMAFVLMFTVGALLSLGSHP